MKYGESKQDLQTNKKFLEPLLASNVLPQATEVVCDEAVSKPSVSGLVTQSGSAASIPLKGVQVRASLVGSYTFDLVSQLCLMYSGYQT